MDQVSPPATDGVPAHWKRNVALFLTGQTVSLFGSMVVQYVVMWYVTLETRSGTAVALYAVAAFLPQGVVSIFAGVLADRMNRKKLIIVADAGIALVTLGLALLMMSGVDDLWILLLAVAVRTLPIGTGYAVWTGIGAAGTALLGILLLNESASAIRIASIGLIVAGIVGLKVAS